MRIYQFAAFGLADSFGDFPAKQIGFGGETSAFVREEPQAVRDKLISRCELTVADSGFDKLVK